VTQTDMAMIPKWIMLGTEGPDPERTCRLWASARLTKAELEIRIDYADDWLVRAAGLPPMPVSHDAELKAFMPATDIVIIDAPTWGQCIAELMRMWTPERGRMPAITMGQREVEAP
jgi:hypothetical protein